MTSAEAYRILKEARALMDPDCEANHTLTVSMGSIERVFTVRGRVVGPVSFDSYDLAQAVGVVLDEKEGLGAKDEPDSLERLADDLGRFEESRRLCDYFGGMASEACDGCPAKHRGTASSCAFFVIHDIARRVGALRAKAEPDSWERLRADTKLRPADYLASRGMDPDKTERIRAMMGDLVDRAEALAGAADD